MKLMKSTDHINTYYIISLEKKNHIYFKTEDAEEE